MFSLLRHSVIIVMFIVPPSVTAHSAHKIYVKISAQSDYFQTPNQFQGGLSGCLTNSDVVRHTFNSSMGKSYRLGEIGMSYTSSNVRWQFTLFNIDMSTERTDNPTKAEASGRIVAKLLDFNSLGLLQKDNTYIKLGLGGRITIPLGKRTMLGADFTPLLSMQSYRFGGRNFSDTEDHQPTSYSGLCSGAEFRLIFTALRGTLILSGAVENMHTASTEQFLQQTRLEAQNIWALSSTIDLVVKARLTTHYFNHHQQDNFTAGITISKLLKL